MSRLSFLLVAIAVIALAFAGADTLAKKPPKPPPDPEPEADPAIAFTTADGLSVMDMDGGNPTEVISDVARHPSFSPDGTRIAYMSDSGPCSVRIVDVDGSNPASIVSMNDAIAYGGVSWSSTNWIAFSDGESSTSIVRDIWIMRPDGSDLVNLTNTPDIEEIAPSWNGTADRLAVSYYRPDRTSTVVVYDIELVGGVPTIVGQTSPSDVVGSPVRNTAMIPSFARNSDRLVVQALAAGESWLSLWVIDLAIPASPRRLTPAGNEADEKHACWSADDSRIVFTSYAWRKAHIFSVRSSDGSDRQILGGRKVVGGHPACRP
jgi:Tol biopolymer transport system component